ncbi:MAG TPA: hypothetical protein VG963_30270 [Polyangiaceae bacterium]|nr:hypothetical protein [Polyangiaceae bacterium]
MTNTSRWVSCCAGFLALSAVMTAATRVQAQEQALIGQPPLGAYGGQPTQAVPAPPPQAGTPLMQTPFPAPLVPVAAPTIAQPALPGQWVNTAQYGWIWVPAGTTTATIDGVPVAYLYMPAHGWTWYASPWGWGPFVYGPWVSRPSPFGFRAWIHGPFGWGWYYGPRVVPRHHGYWNYRVKYRHGRCYFRDGYYYGRGC